MALEQCEKISISDELFARALRQRICPILQTKTNDLLCSLQSEAVYNKDVNALVLSAGGYCHFHFWYLEKLASPATNAQLLENLCKTIENEFFDDLSGNAATRFGEASVCPVCISCNEWEEHLLVLRHVIALTYQTARGLPV